MCSVGLFDGLGLFERGGGVRVRFASRTKGDRSGDRSSGTAFVNDKVRRGRRNEDCEDCELRRLCGVSMKVSGVPEVSTAVAGEEGW
jgi:hypothetical protein